MLQEELNQEQKPWLIFASIAAFAITLFFSVYYEIQQARYDRAIGEMQTKKQELIDQNKSSQEGDRAKAVSAKDYLKELDAKQVIWSKIIEKVESTIPRRSDTLEPVVVFRSYNGSSEGRLAVNATTQPTSADPFTDIAYTIKSFVSDPVFKNVFVPSIARSLTPDGQSVMTFSMNFEYNPSNILVRPRVDSSATATAPDSTTLSATSTSDTVVTTEEPVAPTTPQKPAAPTTPAAAPKP